MQIQGDVGLLLRTDDGQVSAWRITQSAMKYKVKLQDPTSINAFYRLHDRAPGRGVRASMLIMSKAMGKTGKKVSMAAPPVILKCHIPKGASETKTLPWMSFKHNVVEMDENADVTFGVKDYPPWVSRLLTQTTSSPRALTSCHVAYYR